MAIADWSLLYQPVMTSPSPFIIAWKPVSATCAASKKSVSVAPAMRQVTVMPVSLSSARKAKEKESRKALGVKPAIEPVMRIWPSPRLHMSRPTFWIM